LATGLTFRPLNTVLPPYGPGVFVARRTVATVMRAAGGPTRGTSTSRVDTRTETGARVVGEWVTARGVDPLGDTAVLYVHGSGYVVCSTRTHRSLTSRLSAQTGLPVFASEYRLAPRHRFPAAATDVRAAWDLLRAGGLPAERIAVAGDSAGGHLTVDLALDLLRAGEAPPAALALFSPAFDLTFTLSGERDRQRRDPVVSAAAARRVVGRYTHGADPDHPRLALRLDGVTGFPPTLIQAGGTEMFTADAEHLAATITATGAPCHLQIWPGQVHVFQALPRFSSEADRALAVAADFLTAHLGAASPLAIGETR
jgi:acetyl esterase/lipase